MVYLWKKKDETKYLSPERLRHIDTLAKRYGIRPSDLLDGDISRFQFDLLVASSGIEAENKAQERALKAQRKARR